MICKLFKLTAFENETHMGLISPVVLVLPITAKMKKRFMGRQVFVDISTIYGLTYDVISPQRPCPHRPYKGFKAA